MTPRVLLAALWLLTLPLSVTAGEQRFPVRPGYLVVVPLADFAPAPQRAAFEQLRAGKLKEAAVIFRRELEQNPNNLVAYIGLSQADPAWAEQEYARLRSEAAVASALTKAKYGLQIYYHWARLPVRQAEQKDGKRLLPEAGEVLEDAWKGTKAPLAGMLLAVVYNHIGRMDQAIEVSEAVVRQLAGPKAYTLYQKNKASAGSPPPSPALVPPDQLRPLRAALGICWSLLRVRFYHQADASIDPSLRAERLRETEYIERWRKTLKEAAQKSAS